MTTLIRLTTPTELATYEGCAMALTLASFGQTVQIYLASEVLGVLLDPQARLSGMLKSLDLYDMPKAWLPDDVFSGWVLGMINSELASQLDMIPESANLSQFATVLSF